MVNVFGFDPKYVVSITTRPATVFLFIDEPFFHSEKTCASREVKFWQAEEISFAAFTRFYRLLIYNAIRRVLWIKNNLQLKLKI